jgi:hypothetical protein
MHALLSTQTYIRTHYDDYRELFPTCRWWCISQNTSACVLARRTSRMMRGSPKFSRRSCGWYATSRCSWSVPMAKRSLRESTWKGRFRSHRAPRIRFVSFLVFFFCQLIRCGQAVSPSVWPGNHLCTWIHFVVRVHSICVCAVKYSVCVYAQTRTCMYA